MDDNEIKRRLASRAAEYMMFNDDEEDIEVPAEISSSDSVIDFLDLEESKIKLKVTFKVTNEMSLWGAEIKMLLGLFLIHLTNKESVYILIIKLNSNQKNVIINT